MRAGPLLLILPQVWLINYKHFFDPVHGSAPWTAQKQQDQTRNWIRLHFSDAFVIYLRGDGQCGTTLLLSQSGRPKSGSTRTSTVFEQLPGGLFMELVCGGSSVSGSRRFIREIGIIILGLDLYLVGPVGCSGMR